MRRLPRHRRSDSRNDSQKTNYESHEILHGDLTPELSRADLRPRERLKIQKSAEAAKRSRLERIVSAESC